MKVARGLPHGPLLTAVALAAVILISAIVAGRAAAVQPPPQLYVNERNLGTMLIPVYASGRLTLDTTAFGEVTCNDTFYGVGWNEGGHGYGEVLSLTAAQCEAPRYIKETEEGATYKPSIERWIREHGEGRQPTSPVHCAQAETSVGEGRCLTMYTTAERPLEYESGQGEVCTEKAFEEGQTLAHCRESGSTETRTVFAGVRRRTSSLPWRVELFDGSWKPSEFEEIIENGVLAKVGLEQFGETGTSEAESTRCYPTEGGHAASFTSVPQGCIVLTLIVPQIPLEFPFYGTLEPAVQNGAKNGLFPTHLIFFEPFYEHAGRTQSFLASSEGLDGKATLPPEGADELYADGATDLELLSARCEKAGKFEAC